LLAGLVQDGTVTTDEQGRVRHARGRTPARRRERLIGRLTVTRSGAGFVRLEGSEVEIRIPPRFMRTALHGDLVEVIPYARSISRGRREHQESPEGEITAILERTMTTVTGRLEQSGTFWFVVPDDKRLTRDVYVTREDAKKARHGDKVVVRLHPWEDEHLNPEGTIEEVLGPGGDARAEVLSVARSFGLDAKFPRGVEDEATACRETPSADDLEGREDLRDLLCVTIDPADAKDFDDAVSIEPMAHGAVRLGVHIADVSHFVHEGSALDQEARRRGTSVYLVDQVIPMLPERLSNHLCSLRPGVDRLTYSVFMEVTAEGTVRSYRIVPATIRSARRFSYEEVQKILDAGRGEFHDELLAPLHTLSQVLFGQREKNGSLDFDTPEVKVEFDSTGLPSRIVQKERLASHRLIEECMLLANKTVAGHVARPRRAEEVKPFLYRVHDLPDPQKVSELATFVKRCGFSLDASSNVTVRALQKLLKAIRGTEFENIISEVALRSMAKAVYTDRNIGHFGLAFSHYTHFTSPIRRYPDLIVHRLLREYGSGIDGRRLALWADELPEIGRSSSERERNAAEAERASVRIMQIEYMKRHLGDECTGIISGVTNFGLFVKIDGILAEGLVSVRDMADDYYLFDERQYALRGRSGRKTYSLGDRVRVQVAAVKPEDRQIDLTMLR
jgi:ribonuclease R